jgi:hypothetical protein
MKNIEILGDPDIYLLRTWLLPAFFGFLLVLDFMVSKRLNFSIAFSLLAWSIVVMSVRQGLTGKSRKSHYILEFGNQDLICKFKGSVFWHIPISKISHAVEEEISSGSIFLPKRKQFLIYTKEGDSYSIPINMSASQVLEIKTEIEQIANA